MSNTTEEIAREIVAALVNAGCKAGTGLPLQALRARLGMLRDADELNAGIQYAQQHGWIEAGRDGMFAKLTEIGFRESGAIVPSAEEVARELVEILVKAGRKPGTGMPINSLRQQFGMLRDVDELKGGLEFAAAAGWIEFNDRAFIKLGSNAP